MLSRTRFESTLINKIKFSSTLSRNEILKMDGISIFQTSTFKKNKSFYKIISIFLSWINYSHQRPFIFPKLNFRGFRLLSSGCLLFQFLRQNRYEIGMFLLKCRDLNKRTWPVYPYLKNSVPRSLQQKPLELLSLIFYDFLLYLF